MWFRFRPSFFLDRGPLLPRVVLRRVGVGDVLVWSAGLSVIALFGWILVDLLIGGLQSISWEFIFSAPQDAGRAGGVAPILVSTLLILGTCLAFSLPVGLGTALFLSEFVSHASRFGRLVRRSLDVLAGMPSIVFGLFGYAFFCHVLGLGFSILAGGLTLACMVLPILIRACETALTSQRGDLRRAAAAVGLSKSTMIFQLLIPAATPGLLVGVILGIGRALAETAALIFTSGYVDRMPSSLLDSGRALSVHIFDLSMNVPAGDEMARASALLLLALLLIVNGLATWIVQRWYASRVSGSGTMAVG